MYNSNLAAAIKVDGKILREFGDTVYLPFGSEYQIRLKNLNTNRALVHIEIDGEKVTGNGLIVGANETVDLERFIRNGNLSEGNRFKFIERTSKISDHRGNKVEDGLIQIYYEFELPPIAMINTPRTRRPPLTKGIGETYTSGVYYKNISATFNCTSETYGTNSYDTQASLDSYIQPQNETGITVEGSKSNQTFSTSVWHGSIGIKSSMVIRLLGETEENLKIRQPVTVKTKLECKTCGTMNSATAKFCSECGTSLQIV